MKPRKLFLSILFITIFLILLCVWIQKKEYFDCQSTTDYKPVYISVKKTILEAQKEINSLLLQEPIKFSDKDYKLEDNKTLDNIISILNSTVGDMAIMVASHSDSSGSSSFNRKLTQKRADTIVSYINKRCHVKFINAIGYGEEFPLSKEENRTDNRIEIYIKRIYNDF